jgi:hypothetical protein
MSPAFYTRKSSFVKLTAFTVLVMLTSGSANAWAKPEMKGARMGVPADVQRNCRPANGGEISFGFAGPGDWVNPTTGNICFSDRRPIAF